MVYDVTNRESFQKCAKHLHAARQEHGMGDRAVSGVLIANKCDLKETERALVSVEEGQQFAQENNLVFWETSVSNDVNVAAPFEDIARRFAQHYQASVQRAAVLM